MILTRFVRIQLVIFVIATLVGLTVMGFRYIRVQTFLGMGKINVTVELPSAGGLYRFSNVTYRGIQVGKVTSVDLRPGGGVAATMSLDTEPKIPADLQARVRSVSAIGEQYVDLRPRTDSAPYLRDGSVIDQVNTRIPQAVGPMLDQLSALVDTIPKDQLSVLLDESFKGFNGAGDDLGRLIDSSATVANSINNVSDPLRTLIDQTGPLLETQSSTAPQIRQWAHSLAGFTAALKADDPQFRTVLAQGPGFAQEVSRLLGQLKPTLPVFLANLTTVAQVGVTYNPSLEQVLVLLPPMVAVTQSIGGNNNPQTGYLTPADFRLQSADPPPCTVGFLPPNQRRPPSETTSVDTPDGIYCKLPQDSPIAVRGARNLPCMGVPGKRAPTVQMCYSEQQYEPLAERQPLFGPGPRDPNMEAQGIPPADPDVRTNLVPPRPGLPLPESAVGQEIPGPPEPAPGAAPVPEPLLPTEGAVPIPVTPSSNTLPSQGERPPVAVADYDPRTGTYFGSDGKRYQQGDLTTGAGPVTWQDLMLK